MELKPFKGFNYRLNTSFYNRQQEDGEAKKTDYPGGGATAKLANNEKRSYLIENIFTYDVPFRDKNHKLVLTAVQLHYQWIWVGILSQTVSLAENRSEHSLRIIWCRLWDVPRIRLWISIL